MCEEFRDVTKQDANIVAGYLTYANTDQGARLAAYYVVDNNLDIDQVREAILDWNFTEDVLNDMRWSRRQVDLVEMKVLNLMEIYYEYLVKNGGLPATRKDVHNQESFLD